MKTLKIKSIRHVGRGQCYDFAMKVPHNNYFANGVVVHNTPAMSSVAKSFKPKSETDCADLISVNRPGVVRTGMLGEYLKRRKGDKAVVTPHPLMTEVLADTFGVVVYQEQVMRIVQRLAGYSMAEADTIRKIMGKMLYSEMIK